MLRILYRVFPFIDTAVAGQPGSASYLPPQGDGRCDNSDRYAVRYLSDAPAGAVAEAFGLLSSWSTDMLRNPRTASRSAVARYELDDDAAVHDLDDAAALVTLGLRPSEVVTRDRAVTQNWSRRIFDESRWAGVRWWSFYDAGWGSYAIWDLDVLRLIEVDVLTLSHAALREAADLLARPIRIRRIAG